MKKPNNYWSKEKCWEESLKYKTRIELKKNNGSVYIISLKNKWLDEICSHMKYMNEYWDYQKCKNIALKYTNRTDFQIKQRGAYEFSRLNGFLDEICNHMETHGNQYKRCIYSFEFSNNYAYVGLTYNLKERKLDHLTKTKSPIYKHIKKYNVDYKLKQLTEYIDIEESKKLEEFYVNHYLSNDWNILNKGKTGGIGGNIIKWDYESCKKESLKYKHRNDFRKGKPGAYNMSRKYGFLDEICSHMIIKPHPNKWTIEDEEFLLNNYYKGKKYCAEKLNRTPVSVKLKYKKIKKQNNKKVI